MDHIQGRFFNICGKVLMLGNKLFAYVDEKNQWVMRADGNASSAVPPNPIAAELERTINNGHQARKYIGVGVVGLFRLWCEGVITPEHFRKAVETDTYIEVPDVVLAGMPRVVRMYADPKLTLFN